jgi:hypothetical protein
MKWITSIMINLSRGFEDALDSPVGVRATDKTRQAFMHLPLAFMPPRPTVTAQCSACACALYEQGRGEGTR